MINRIVLVGRITADIDVKYTQNGTAVTNFSIAVERQFRNSSGEKETDFINIVAWKKLAELIGEYMKKGSMIGIDGSLQVRKYETREGEKRTAYEVRADNCQFLDIKGANASATSLATSLATEPASQEEDDDGLPF